MHTKFKILMLVRHGQSTGNVDQPTHDHASIPLTALITAEVFTREKKSGKSA